MEDSGYDPDLLANDLHAYEVVDLSHWRGLTEDALAEACRSVSALVTGRKSPQLPDALIDDRGDLQLLAHAHGTVKHLVSSELIQAGLTVTNWGAQAANGVAESAMALTLSCLKQVHLLNDFIRRDWSGDERLHQAFSCSLNGRDVGVYGMGPIGSRYAQLLTAFNAKVHYYDPFVDEPVVPAQRHQSLNELFAACQIVSIHCGLNDVTHHSVAAEQLALLPQGGVVVNTARGGVINEPDLVVALQEKRLIAGLDVIEKEGQWAQSPLAQLPNVLLSGHVMGNGKGYPPGEAPPRRIAKYVLANLAALANGDAFTNVVTAEAYAIKT